MIKKIFLQSIVSAMLFLIVLFSFSRVDWLSVFDLRETVIEEKLGDMYWDLYSGSAVFSGVGHSSCSIGFVVVTFV